MRFKNFGKAVTEHDKRQIIAHGHGEPVEERVVMAAFAIEQRPAGAYNYCRDQNDQVSNIVIRAVAAAPESGGKIVRNLQNLLAHPGHEFVPKLSRVVFQPIVKRKKIKLEWKM